MLRYLNKLLYVHSIEYIKHDKQFIINSCKVSRYTVSFNYNIKLLIVNPVLLNEYLERKYTSLVSR